MLGVHGIGRERADYYLSDPARELPVAAPAQWAGCAAEGLGLTGAVRAEEFRRLLQSRHPCSGLLLGSGRVSVPAFDLTFSAPKSASVLFALGGAAAARTVVDAHEKAVAGSLSYLEQHAITATRQSGPSRLTVPTSGAVAAVFTHGVSRNGDPHVHSHVVMANVVHGADGRWGACDRRGIAAHRLAASAVYEAHLRAELTATLGVHWRSGTPGRSAEVAHVGPELLGAFSTRGADIRRHRYESAARSGRGAHIAWAATRPAKTPSARFADLENLWRQRADDVGGRLERRPGRGPTGRAVLDEHRFAGVISLPAHGGAYRRDVVAAFGAAARDGVTASALDRLVAQWVPPGPGGVAEPLRQRRTVVPANHHLRALGPRPIDPDDHAVWLGAARALDAYRGRWGLAHAQAPLGEAPNVTRLPARRLADHIRTERVVEAARARLGWRERGAVDQGRER